MMRGFGQDGGMMNGGFIQNGVLVGANWWLMLIGMAIHLLFWLGIFILAYRFLKHLSLRHGVNKAVESQAMRILRERYAKGEIDTEDFNTRKKDLED